MSTVSSAGLLTVQGLGNTYVSATMTRDSSNQDDAHIYVLVPDDIKILAQPLEQEVGKSINLHVQLFATVPGTNEKKSITVCNHNQFKVEIEDSDFTLNNINAGSHLNTSCTAFSLRSEQVASTKVTVFFYTKSAVLKATVIVSTYKKLVPLRPESKRTVLAPGCSTTLLFNGGPQPWLGHSAGYKVEFEIDENLVLFRELPVIRDVNGHKTYAYSVTCQSLGSTRANLTIKSIPVVDRFESGTISQTSVEIFCAIPKFVKVFADTEDNCPVSKSSNNIFAYIHERLFVRIDVIDENGNVFDNATMINASWKIPDSDLVRVISSLDLNEVSEYGFSFPDYHYSILEPLGKEGSAEAVFELTGYKKQFFVPNSSRFSSFLTTNDEVLEIVPSIKHSVSLLLFDNPRLTQEEILVIHNPKTTKSIYSHQGSGYFKIHLSTQKVAKVTHNGGRQIDITPLSPGDLVISIKDLCVKSKIAEATFKVRNIHRMELLTNSFVEIGKTIRAIIKFYDSEGYPLPIQSGTVNIKPAVEVNSMLTIKPEPGKPEQEYETEFSIMGSLLGKTNLYFVADIFPTNEIRTQTASIQVYSQLQLSPKNLTLAVGSSYQLIVSGGPHLECVYEFVSDDEKVSKVSNGGIVKGVKIGTVTITGMAVGIDVLSGMKVVYSKDIVTIRVIKLNNIKIEVPLLKLKVGEVMPAWVRGVPDALSPIIIGTIQPSLIFHWTTSSAGIVQIYDVLENTGILVNIYIYSNLFVKYYKNIIVLGKGTRQNINSYSCYESR